MQWSSSQYSTYMYVCYDSSNFALHYITIQGFFRNIALKGYLTQRWYLTLFQFDRKTFFKQSVDPK